MSDTNRLDNIEITLAEQEQQIADLSEMVARQWREIEGLKDALKQAELRMSEMAQQSSASAVMAARMTLGAVAESDEQDEAMSVADQALAMKPPHY
jgi:uncharacterized coiled-coil protein SlyX